MNKFPAFILCLLSLYITSFGQSTNKTLFIIDSIPLLNDPEEWNQILQEDIAEYRVITQKDSLKLLGWAKVDQITYIFTKEYKKRPDSIKRIPSLKQMTMKNDVWNQNDTPYTGRYIDYYNNGRIQDQGMLVNGKLNGELIVYYKNGIKKSITNYRDGIRNGIWKDYYKNGALMRQDEYINGKANRTGKLYFINGQIQQELKLKKGTLYDTLIMYYSTGKVKQVKITRTGEFHPGKKESDLNYYRTMFFEHLRTEDITEANKDLYQILKIDSTSTDTYFKKGLLLATEFRFDMAIAEFDKALAIEPLMRESLEQRARTRIKKYKYLNAKAFPKNSMETPLTIEDIIRIPNEEQIKVCNDLTLADDLNAVFYYGKYAVPETILNYCRTKGGH